MHSYLRWTGGHWGWRKCVRRPRWLSAAVGGEASSGAASAGRGSEREPLPGPRSLSPPPRRGWVEPALSPRRGCCSLPFCPFSSRLSGIVRAREAGKPVKASSCDLPGCVGGRPKRVRAGKLCVGSGIDSSRLVVDGFLARLVCSCVALKCSPLARNLQCL